MEIRLDILIFLKRYKLKRIDLRGKLKESVRELKNLTYAIKVSRASNNSPVRKAKVPRTFELKEEVRGDFDLLW